jgi:twitching motility protein PilT
MRDSETIRTAITAAETGHTVIATIHTKGAVNAIDRIIDTFAGSYQDQFRFQLATVLHTVVSQQMLPAKNDTMIPAFELMHVNNAIRSMIRDNKNHQINNAISSGSREGMVTMDQSVLALYRMGRITRQTALDYADNPDQVQRRMG